MNQIKVWPHMTVVAILVAVLAGLGVALYLKHEQTAAAQELPYEARIQRVDGDVAFSENLPNVDPNSDQQWTAATANQPFSVGDRIYTREKSRASLAFSGRNFARLDPNTSLDVIALEDRRTQLALREGSAIFDVGYLAPGELFEVGTPYGAVDFNEPGLYNVGFDNNGSVLVSALSGVAQVVGLAGSGQISKGELLTLVGQTAAQVALSRLNGNDAAYLVDDYYRYQYPNTYDGRYYDNYDAYLSDPYYYDPYRRDVSYQYVNYGIPGANDLTYYGDWQNVDGYGYAWSPRVDAGWAPYQDGYWVNDYPYGLTWVSSEPWGYAPYHYGRWANAGGRWVWVPDSLNTTPVYSPALVAFLPFNDANQIGWVPLGPGDYYAPRYYDTNWQPRYLTRVDNTPVRLVNLAIPEAVTVVPLDSFGRDIDRRHLRRLDRNELASVRPTLDPLTFTPLRNAAVHSAWGRGKKDLPPGIAKKLNETPVFVGDLPRSRFARFGRDGATAMRVERIPDQARKQKFQVRDERNVGRDNAAAVSDQARQAFEQQTRQAFEQQNRQRQQQIDSLRSEAARGNRQAERQARQLEQQNRQAQQQQARKLEQQTRQAEQQRRNETRVQAEAARVAERAQRRAAQQPQGQRVGNPRKIQPQTEPHRPPMGEPKPEKQRPQAQPRSQPRYQLPPRQEVQRQPRPQAQPRSQPVPRLERSQPRPQAERPQQQVQQQPRAQSQSQGAAKHQERQQQPAAQPGGPPQGGGKGKGKKP